MLQRDQCKNKRVKYAAWFESRSIRLQSTMTSSQTCYIGGHADSDLNTATEESRHITITMSLKDDWGKEREVRMVDFAIYNFVSYCKCKSETPETKHQSRRFSNGGSET